jgi:hypothetical protein
VTIGDYGLGFSEYEVSDDGMHTFLHAGPWGDFRVPVSAFTGTMLASFVALVFIALVLMVFYRAAPRRRYSSLQGDRRMIPPKYDEGRNES